MTSDKNIPPSDEGGGKTAGFDGGRDKIRHEIAGKVSLPRYFATQNSAPSSEGANVLNIIKY